MTELTAEDRIENALQAASETQPDWKHRCHAIMTALGFDFGDPDFMIPDEVKKLEAAESHLAASRRQVDTLSAALLKAQLAMIGARDVTGDKWPLTRKTLIEALEFAAQARAVLDIPQPDSAPDEVTQLRAFAQRVAALVTPYDEIRAKNYRYDYNIADHVRIDPQVIIEELSEDTLMSDAQASWELTLEARKLLS